MATNVLADRDFWEKQRRLRWKAVYRRMRKDPNTYASGFAPSRYEAAALYALGFRWTPNVMLHATQAWPGKLP